MLPAACSLRGRTADERCSVADRTCENERSEVARGCRFACVRWVAAPWRDVPVVVVCRDPDRTLEAWVELALPAACEVLEAFEMSAFVVPADDVLRVVVALRVVAPEVDLTSARRVRSRRAPR